MNPCGQPPPSLLVPPAGRRRTRLRPCWRDWLWRSQLALALLCSLSLSPSVQAQQPLEPPVRPYEDECLQSLSYPLPVALKPGESLPLTLAARPTFFWYMPRVRSGYLEFTLAKPLDDTLERETIVHHVQLSLTPTAAIAGYQLPATVEPLEPNQLYRWSVVLFCREPGQVNNDLSDGIMTHSWVERLPADDPIAQQIQGAKPTDGERFAAAGLWHETFLSLAHQRLAHPEDHQIWMDWRNFLTSVELGHFAPFPILFYETSGAIAPSASPDISPE